MLRRATVVWVVLAAALAAGPRVRASQDTAPAARFPRLANLWGASPQSTEYDRWARYDMLVVNAGPDTAWRRFCAEVRRRNPRTVILGTGEFMNLFTGAPMPWMKDEWFLRRPDGSKVSWWAEQIAVPNLMLDACFDALLARVEETYGRLLRDRVIDGLFFDTVMGRATWLGDVDTDRDGKADVQDAVDARWHARQCEFFDRLRARYPGMRIVANDVDPGHRPHVHGRLFEGATLLDRVRAGTITPQQVTADLQDWMALSAQPGLTFTLASHPLGWQGWRVGKGQAVTTAGELDRVRRDFARMRTGLAVALMSDAYHTYDVGTVLCGLTFDYAEYRAPLGRPLGPAVERHDVPPAVVLDWRAGHDAGAFRTSDTTARAASDGLAARVSDVGSGWTRLIATDPRRVRLEPGKTYRITAELDVQERASGTFQFTVRTGAGGWEKHDKGNQLYGGASGQPWRLEATVVPDDFDDYAAEWHLLGTGALRLKRLRITRIGDSRMERAFEGGLVVLSAAPRRITFATDRPLWRLRDAAAPRHVVEVDDDDARFTCAGAWERRAGEGHHVGASLRVAAKPGATAAWRFQAPSTDTYTVWACVPDRKGLTGSAVYTVRGPRVRASGVLDQRGRDGGWYRVLSVHLGAGELCTVEVTSGGGGATVADAIRLESTARYNDGARVRSVTLEPFDGAVLLNAPPPPGLHDARRARGRSSPRRP